MGLLGPALAQETPGNGVPPDAATLLFDEPQLAGTSPGEVLTYAYSRTSTEPERFGPSFDDRLRLKVDKGSSAATRNIAVEMFSGPNRRPAGPFEDMTGNPLLSLILEQDIQTLAGRLGGNPHYFKTAIRTALRDRARLSRDMVPVGPDRRPGWRIEIRPFENDPHLAQAGLDRLTYVFRIAPDIPGEIYAIDIMAADPAGAPVFEETISYVGKTD